MNRDNQIRVFWIDLFSGAGGTTSGIHLAAESKNIYTKVVACVNHDENAIKSHLANHPDCVHFTEDIRDFEVVRKLKKLVNKLRLKHPECIINIWASLECTNFSKAKGGLPRDGDSRTLAEHMFMYQKELDPDYMFFENVVEFMSWGPLDENGKPLRRRSGSDYIKWVNRMQANSYRFDFKELNAADYGAYTSRNRWFGQFSKEEFPIRWPEKTHAKKATSERNLFNNNLKPWKPVKEVLNLENEGNSIFSRKRPLVENTLKRIYAGLVKFVANGDDIFIKKYFSGRPEGKVISVNGPCGTITTINGQAIVQCEFILKYNSTNKNGHHNPPGVNEPCPTVAAQNRLGVVNINFLQSYYGNGGAHSISEPCPTVSTKDRFASISANFIDQQYGNSKPKSIEEPLNTITNVPKFGYVTAKHFLFDHQFKNTGYSIEKPSPTVIARQDKKPMGIIVCNHSNDFVIPIYEQDSETMIKIKQFMAYFGICDIKMRMLEVEELLKIQGFPIGYKLVGNQTDQKKFIGNSVEVRTAKSIVLANYLGIVEHSKISV